MDSGETQQQHEPRKVLRCVPCGVESLERTCFILPGQYGGAPRDIRCITCEERRLARSAPIALLTLFSSLFLPFWLMVGLVPSDTDLHAPTLVFAFLLFPFAVIGHELGHAVTAYIIGLEVGGIGIGFGRVVWKFGIRGLPIQLHSWPFSGRVYLGAPDNHVLRTRLWVATLMGPMTNILLAGATGIWWKPLLSFFGAPAVYLWWTTNLFLAAVTLFPRRIRRGSSVVPTDGLALLQIPRFKGEKLDVYLHSALLVRAISRYEDGDFVGTLFLVRKALARTPHIVVLRLIEAASYLADGKYQAGIDTVEPLLRDSPAQDALIRAGLKIDLAFGLLMSNVGASAESPPLQEADQLSREAFEAYPCVLEFRCNRAFALAAAGRAEQALQILDYVHFKSGTRRQRSQCQATRAFALRMLNKPHDAEEAAACAVKLDRAILKTVQSMGFSPTPGVKVSRQVLSRSASS